MIPKPFKRPSIEIGERVTRRWVDTEARNIAVGDMVQDMGQVVRASTGEQSVVLKFFSGDVLLLSSHAVVRAFTEGARVGLSE